MSVRVSLFLVALALVGCRDLIPKDLGPSSAVLAFALDEAGDPDIRWCKYLWSEVGERAERTVVSPDRIALIWVELDEDVSKDELFFTDSSKGAAKIVAARFVPSDETAPLVDTFLTHSSADARSCDCPDREDPCGCFCTAGARRDAGAPSSDDAAMPDGG